MLNFMTLFRMAEIILVKPSILKRMKSYAMWQTFWDTNMIYIS